MDDKEQELRNQEQNNLEPGSQEHNLSLIHI